MSPYITSGISLSRSAVERVEVFNRDTYCLPAVWLDVAGDVIDKSGSRQGKRDSSPFGLWTVVVSRDMPDASHAIREALSEAYRWGEPFLFFLYPGLLAWIVPLCDAEVLLGGICSGGVLLDEADRSDVVTHLRGDGVPATTARRVAAGLPVWDESRPMKASSDLYQVFYQVSGWTPVELVRRRENASQQRQIAETIHSHKAKPDHRYPLKEEQRLIAMMRAGDHAEARRELNKLLAALFVHAPGLSILRARAVELMGHLVRVSIDDNPRLEPLIDMSQDWLESIFAATTFEELAVNVRLSLDSFLAAVAINTSRHASPSVRRAMAYIRGHYAEPITLSDVADASALSTYRVSHLVKEVTGRTVMQNVRALRIAKAQELLETTDLAGATIAARLGFHDQSHFIREFRAACGVTPLHYRRDHHGSISAQTG